MNRRNPESPWNPGAIVEVAPDEYERQVVAWLAGTEQRFDSFKIRHQAALEGSSGEYTFDGLAEFEIFGGAKVVVLIECKRHARPVNRDYVMTLESKLRDVGAHKAMLFSTAGFQRGALEYAAERGIATITFIDGNLTYETRSLFSSPDPPPGLNLPRFAAYVVTADTSGIQNDALETDRTHHIDSWLCQ